VSDAERAQDNRNPPRITKTAPERKRLAVELDRARVVTLLARDHPEIAQCRTDATAIVGRLGKFECFLTELTSLVQFAGIHRDDCQLIQCFGLGGMIA
jgi:hypothetical protein